MDLNFVEIDSGKTLDTILTLLEQANEAPLYPGDERRIFGEALAMVINTTLQTMNDGCRQRLLRYARGEVLDALGESRGVKRIQPSKAETILQFSVSSPLSFNIIIPAGIRVTGFNSLYFETTKTVVLAAGALSVNTPATSIEGGGQYNDIEAGELNAIVDKSAIPQIESVSNIIVTSGGGSVESDDSLRERIRTAENIISCGTESSYKYWTISVNPKIADALVTTGEEVVSVTKPIQSGKVYLCAPNIKAGSIRSPNPFSIISMDDDGLITLQVEDTNLESLSLTYTRYCKGVVTVMPILAGGEIPSAVLLDEVEKFLNRPDVKPLTDKVQVIKPEPVYYDIELEYWCSVRDEPETIQALEKPDGAISNYIFWQDSVAGADINPDQLMKFCLCPHDGTGAQRVKVIQPTYQELAPTQVAKHSGKLVISHHVKG